MTHHRFGFALFLAVAAVAVAAVSAGADSVDEVKVAKIKSAHVWNFLKFTTWPERSFHDATSPIVIVVLGADTLGPALDQTVAGKKIGDRPVEIRRVEHVVEGGLHGTLTTEEDPEFLSLLNGAHLLFVTAAYEHHFTQILAAIEGRDLLTVGDGSDFARQGGMIGLAVRNDRVVFDVNPGAIKRTRVDVSSKILKLGRVVESAQE